MGANIEKKLNGKSLRYQKNEFREYSDYQLILIVIEKLKRLAFYHENIKRKTNQS
ncbi:MAG: hypothetical protein KC550_04885 [Nanoarchaeota archaeon]|nr:hypothetical protein [Nanoarchaeota archaeon]